MLLNFCSPLSALAHLLCVARELELKEAETGFEAGAADDGDKAVAPTFCFYPTKSPMSKEDVAEIKAHAGEAIRIASVFAAFAHWGEPDVQMGRAL